jgi:nitrite reductase (cytochrome c-552)
VTKRRRLFLILAAAAVALVAAAGITALLVNIFTRKQEARNPFFRVATLTEETVDPAVWGKNFPSQYDGYRRTVDMVRTRYGGSEALPRTPDKADPRSIVSRSRLEEDPRLKTMWAGYAFAVDFREERGHAYMLDDQTFTERQRVKPQPGACLNCHASFYVAYKKLGAGDIFQGFAKLNAMPYAEARRLASHPVACIDCHDPETMDLRVTRPGFLNGIQRLAESDEALPHLPSIQRWRESDRDEPYDPNADASRQELRTFVCGQCHVEYYFKGEQKLLTYPWHDGVNSEDIESYYDEVGWSDWEHARSGAGVLKAQHPEFETWNTGVHARSGVACADCHMPYTREGAAKVSDHHVRSPLLNGRRACGSCHPYDEAEIVARAETIQDRTKELLDAAETATVELIEAIVAAEEAGASDERLAGARDYQRKAQWRTDFVNAENSMGFHSPQETARNLGLAIDFARRGMIELARPLE